MLAAQTGQAFVPQTCGPSHAAEPLQRATRGYGDVVPSRAFSASSSVLFASREVCPGPAPPLHPRSATFPVPGRSSAHRSTRAALVTELGCVVVCQAESVQLRGEDGQEGGRTQGTKAQAEAEAEGGEEELVEWVVSGSDGSMPLDVVLARRFPELSRRVCRRLLQADKVQVNGIGQSATSMHSAGEGLWPWRGRPVMMRGCVCAWCSDASVLQGGEGC